MTLKNDQPAQKPYVDDSSNLDIQRYLQILYVHRWLFIIVFFLAALLTILYFKLNEKSEVYSSTVEVFYVRFSDEIHYTINTPYSIGPSISHSNFDRNFWLSVMRSQEAMRLTIENSKLPLGNTDEFWNISVNIKPPEGEKNIGDLGQAPVFLLTVNSTNARHVPVLIEAYINSINELLKKYQIDNSKNLVKFISTQLHDNNQQLNDIDRKIIDRHSTNPFLARDIENIVQDIESFRTSLLDARIQLASVSAARAKAENELGTLDGTIISESAFSEPLKVQLMNLHVDLARARTRNTENHPNVMAIRDNINQINQMLRDSVEQQMEIRSEAIDPIKQQLTIKYLDQIISEISLQAKIASLEEVIADLESKVQPDTTNTNHQQLTRNREMVIMTINQLNARLIETQSQAYGGLQRFMTIDKPGDPVAADTKSLLMIIAIAFFAGLFSGTGAVVIYDLIDNRIMLARDYERFYMYPVIGAVRFFKDESFKTLVEKMKNNLNWRQDEFATISVNIIQTLKHSQGKTIALISPVRSEGKSSTVLKLVRYLSENNKKVLMVDFDLFDPGMTRELEASEPGVSNYLKGTSSPEELVRKSKVNNMHYIPSGKINSESDIVDYGNDRIKELLSWAADRYDVVIIDTPAVLYIPDVVFLLDHVDFIIPVVRLKFTNRRSLDSMLKLIKKENRSKITGTIVRNIQYFPLDRYSYYKYYPGYHYGYGYKKEND